MDIDDLVGWIVSVCYGTIKGKRKSTAQAANEVRERVVLFVQTEVEKRTTLAADGEETNGNSSSS